uniref:Zinc-finger domain-containing protein n=1 Tax=Leptobrachium leishanense TaxID=445787 RepID=A0A8C5PBD1_9ANUR
MPQIKSVLKKTPSKDPSSGTPTRFSLRVAFKNIAMSSESSEDETEENDTGPSRETPIPPPVQTVSSDSEDEQPANFLQRRAKNIEDNKAMLAKLMADLEKLPGSLTDPIEPGGSSSTPRTRRGPRSKTPQQQRRNPERATRRLTRSMGGVEPASPETERKRQLMNRLQEDLMAEEEATPRRRRSSRPSALIIPHVVRPVEEITQADLKKVADSVRDKVYHSVNGFTCHQCRQKTIDTKSNCRNVECQGIRGQFCGPCLRNRYGEDVRKVLLDPMGLDSIEYNGSVQLCLQQLWLHWHQPWNRAHGLLERFCLPRIGNAPHAEGSAIAVSVASEKAGALLACFFH